MRLQIMALATAMGLAQLATTAQEAPPAPTAAALAAAEGIRREALLPPNGPQGRPLPLASHWNVGRVKGSYAPKHQLELLQQGHRVLPWMAWPQGDPESERFQSYWAELLGYCAKLKLPISFRGTQWESMLVKKEYRQGPDEQWAGVILPDGKRKSRLSPFGAVAPWKDPAKAYVDTPAMKWVQETYPDPPLVLWVSNNEAPTLRWKKHGPLEEQSKRYLDKYGKDKSDEFKREVVGQGWIERYPVMFKAMRQALVNETWRENARFVGYGAFGPSHFGRWSGWLVYSLITDEYVSPDWYSWQGGSPSYYTHNWNDNRDHWVFSTQVQAMNWVFQLEEALQVNPNFWWEISTWDGNNTKSWMQGLGVAQPEELVQKSSAGLPPAEREKLDPKLLKNSKTLQYLAEGQTYTLERSLGWVQFGLWLVRPRAVREFRGSTTPLAPTKAYWLQTVKAVDRVWAEPALVEFWRRGELVHNRAHRHPYQVAIPAKYKDVHRWYLLDTSLDPPRPWKQKTDLPVFSLALVLGEKGARRWLVYAHSPLQDRKRVGITIPDYRQVQIDVPVAGAFYLVNEATGKVKEIVLP